MFKLRLVSRLLVSTLTVSWLIPLWLSVRFFLGNMVVLEGEILTDETLMSPNYPFLASISPFSISQSYMEIAIIIFAVVLFFWSFILFDKLWPINKK
ncbi:MAG: hypothetical protein WC770_09310 [Phycisphaerae bacterium]|jgi:hypothetical protein